MEVTAGLAEVMAAYHRVNGLKSPADKLPVHWDQLRAQCSVMSMGELYLFTRLTAHSYALLSTQFRPCSKYITHSL